MTTNGYLLDPTTAERLIELGVKFYQISLDGHATQHDQTRKRADGSGTFDRIWQNLLALRDSSLEFEIMLRVHFSPANYDSMAQLVPSINAEFSSDSRFKVYFKAIEKLGSPNDNKFKIFDEEQKNLTKAILDQSLSSSQQIFQEEGPYVCYASKPNSLMIRCVVLNRS